MPESNRTSVRPTGRPAHKSLSMKDCFGDVPPERQIAPPLQFGYLMSVSEGVLVEPSRAGNQRLGRDARGGALRRFRSPLTALRRRAVARRPVGRHALPAGAGRGRRRRAPTRRRSPPISRRSSATPPASAPISTTRARPRRRRRAVIADDQCPLCRFAAQAVAFVPPDAPALPERLDAGRAYASALRLISAPFPACPAQRNRARAPPLAV